MGERGDDGAVDDGAELQEVRASAVGLLGTARRTHSTPARVSQDTTSDGKDVGEEGEGGGESCGGNESHAQRARRQLGPCRRRARSVATGGQRTLDEVRERAGAAVVGRSFSW